MLRRKRISQRIGAVLTTVLTLGLTVGILPAAARPTSVGGSVDLNDLLAGQTRTFKLSITHGGSAGGGIGPLATPPDESINWIRITPPGGLIDPSAARGPGGWQGRIISSGQPESIVFEGGTLAPQQSAVFEVDAGLARPAADEGDDWVVEASDDDGRTAKQATGNLFTLLRVLQTQSVSIVAPAGATDLSVTSTQDGVCARTRVFNAGSATLDVTPTLSGGSQVTVGQPRLASATPCANPAISSAPVAAGAVQEFDFPLSFGSQGTRTLVADASAPGADAFDTNVNVTVQPKAVLSYVGGSLNPRALPPGALGETFRLNVNKAPGGSPAITLDSSATTFEFAACSPPKQLASEGGIGAGAVSNVELSFAPCDLLPTVGNGTYDVTAQYAYVDANGLVQGVTDLGVGDDIRLDDLIPDVDVRIQVPASKVPGEDGAVTDGVNFTVEVDVDDTRADGTLGPCPASNGVDGCSINDAFLRFFDGANTQVGTDHPLDIQNTSGRNSKTVNLNPADIPAEAKVVRAFASAVDDAGNTTPAPSQSDPVDVDIIHPFIELTESSPAMGRREITVLFNEGVIAGESDFSNLDWTVEVDGENNPVTNVRRPTKPDSAETDYRRAVLTVQNPLPCDITAGSVRYDPFEAPGGVITNAAFRDRVDQEIEDLPQTKPLGDGIAPLAPVVEQVQGRGEQVGKYWFNDPQPTTTAGNVDDEADCLGVNDGYTLELFEDRNDNGEFDGTSGGDVRLATADADDLDATFSTFDGAFLGESTTNGRFEAKAFVRSFDTNGNPTAAADVTAAATDWVLDEIAPAISGVVVAGNDVTVNFDEDVSFGRDFTADWSIWGTKPGRTGQTRFGIAGVDGGPASRTLHADEDSGFGPTITDIKAEYFFTGSADGRYTDRAGNTLGDAVVAAG